jgi:hypothetical protein
MLRNTDRRPSLLYAHLQIFLMRLSSFTVVRRTVRACSANHFPGRMLEATVQCSSQADSTKHAHQLLLLRMIWRCIQPLHAYKWHPVSKHLCSIVAAWWCSTQCP